MAGATIQTINSVYTALTATAVTSGVAVVLSGVGNDYEAVIIGDLYESGILTINAGDYDNGVMGAYTSSSIKGLAAITNLDGSKYRQDDGTITMSVNTSGNLYFLTR